MGICRDVRTHFFVEVLIDLFQKVAGVGGAHENQRFLFVSFFFCASFVKRKSGQQILIRYAATKLRFFAMLAQTKPSP